ncbi:MAG: T9SS type A sorting domain-containing protein [bacterium]|nr:T9SS type A sorting domain-containing protein [bacterium]MDD6833132.1 T9SS type A sorting domain-containing protein [bacterium]MDD6901060.1 T9SS type A sorting domain-containing protein [bacterium]MDY4185039.1 T9SS type A sorting domain-containing protein [Sodaliphilus sp.]
MLLISMCVGDMAHAQMQWREVQHKVQSKSLVDPAQTDGVEIFGKDGVITIRTQRRVTVRVFTILGQLVSQSTLNVGSYELKVGLRGVFIVKIGNITQKVAL